MSLMRSTEELDLAEDHARTLRNLLEGRVFTLLVSWFRESSAIVRREARSRGILQPYAQQLGKISVQQYAMREEARERRRVLQEENHHAVEFLLVYKYESMLASYWVDWHALYQQIVLLPRAITVGVALLQEHANFRAAVLEEDHHLRYSYSLQYRVAARAAVLTTERGDLAREESYARGDILVEWDVETIARYREFRLEDSIFQLERFIMAQSSIRQDEDAARDTMLHEESQSFFTLCNSSCAYEHWASYHERFLTDIIGQEYVDTVVRQMTIIKLLRCKEDEAYSRLFLLVEESNAFHREYDVLVVAYQNFRRLTATIQLQKWGLLVIAKQRVRDRRCIAMQHTNHRVASEDADYQRVLRQKRMHAAFIVVPFIYSRLSTQRRFDICRRNFAVLIRPYVAAFTARKRLGNLAMERQLLTRLETTEAMMHLACTMQRIGRGCLAREEVCDISLEQQEAVQSILQREHVAALAIQWMWREFQLQKHKEQEVAKRAQRRIESKAAVKIQSVVRRMFARQFYTLLLLPRYHARKAQLLQRTLRGAQVRRRMHREKLARIVQRFVLAFTARRSVTEHRQAPFARKIQCLFRCTVARQRFTKLGVARNGKELQRAKNAYAVCIQSLYRGHVVRKRNREAGRIAMQVRLTMLECDASGLEDDLWRIGRGFVARRALFARKAHRIQQLERVQSSLRSLGSQHLRLIKEEEAIESLCHRIMTNRVCLVQAILHQRLSAQLIDAKHVDRCERNRQVVQLQAMLSRCHNGFVDRQQIGAEFARRQRAGTVIHCCVSGYHSRRASGNQYAAFVVARRKEVELRAVRRIARAYKRHYNKRRIAAIVLQRSLVLLYWPRLVAKSEVNEARRTLYDLHRRSLLRYEQQHRFSLVENEWALRGNLLRDFKCPEWVQLVQQLAASQPRLHVPEHLEARMMQKRLAIESDAVLGLLSLRNVMADDRLNAWSVGVKKQHIMQSGSMKHSEQRLRRRLEMSQVECRRSISLFFHASIVRMFGAKQRMLWKAENTDRDFISAEWQREADVGLQKSFAALQLLLASSSPQTAAPPQTPEPPLEVHAPTQVTVKSKSKCEASKVRSALLRKFAMPSDPDVPPANISDADFSGIFGRVLGESAGVRKSPRAAQSARDPASAMIPTRLSRPSSTNSSRQLEGAAYHHQKPRLLPPLQADQDVSVLQPRPDEPSYASAAYDAHLLRERAKDDIQFTAEGIVDTTKLAGGLTDETISLIESLVRSRIVTGLILPHARISTRSLLHLLRVCRVSKAPLSIIDVSHNLLIDDVAANHLADMIDSMASLVDVRIAGTRVTPGKRLYIFHALEQKRQGPTSVVAQSVGALPSNNAAKNSVEGNSDLPPVRLARPIQLPRRNGWGTQFKEYEVTPKPGRAEAIFKELDEAKADDPLW